MRCLLFLLLTLVAPDGAAAASIGIDFGSERMTVASARSSARDISIVPNRLGYRSSPTLIGFAVRRMRVNIVSPPPSPPTALFLWRVTDR